MTDKRISRLLAELDKAILGKPLQLKQLLSCILAGGHVLLEDQPGMGKTSLAKALAQVLGLDSRRVQFTNDMLPADILGVSIYEPNKQSFRFKVGPIFTQVLLADELNRATPKTQSALLEAMAEHQISVEGKTHRLPEPFVVIATQNPNAQQGTYPLPESQLDRFMMRLSLGYPSAEFERRVLRGDIAEVSGLDAILNADAIAELRAEVDKVQLSEALLDYIQALLVFTRSHQNFSSGLSTRAAIALIAAAKSWATIAGRKHVIPDDIQAMVPLVAGHRLAPHSGVVEAKGMTDFLLESVPVIK